jgi:hypothetical protein
MKLGGLSWLMGVRLAIGGEELVQMRSEAFKRKEMYIFLFVGQLICGSACTNCSLVITNQLKKE